ncbi:probable E3 ubiquitin-protein ligase XBOS34 [Dendrobium catenatum]|uniref:Putative E3 ubiquitin-protein ligase XBOS34 n=1 Tax=Dendrobium catenatum TaxID=906689 RepID=A0A2I0X4D4_9ASPA|nr:probable E3 ubiquitin-protein ligase XBOS34 [Dendrobium catenatum]PKU82778.1 putative E3 ubiquitin-protein ligase XBOS34 [Dendrobium catenatum]
MGAKQSKEELLYQKVNQGNVEGIKTLRYGGAGLEWVDKEGKSPLILACTRSDLLQAAKVLIEMGANVNAYRPGSHAGTPLHHAARKGLEKTINLLLSNGANPLLMNDDSKTPLDVARARGHSKVVRAIEKRICLFSGWIREIHGPSILEAFVPQLVSKKIWAVVLPCNSRNPMNPQKFELAIYPNLQVSHPRTVVALWKAQIEQPNFNQPDPVLIVQDTNKKSRSKFLSATEGDKQQMLSFYNACRGIYQFSHLQHTNFVSPPPAAPPLPPNKLQATNTNCPEDTELTMAINASIQTAINEGVLLHHGRQHAEVGTIESPKSTQPNFTPKAISQQIHTRQTKTRCASHSSLESVPSAPPFSEDMFYTGSIQYPSIDLSSIDAESMLVKTETREDRGTNSSPSFCVICLDALIEGACVPCGHMAGCMSCLKEIKAEKGECPVCRTKIEQIVKLYTV